MHALSELKSLTPSDAAQATQANDPPPKPPKRTTLGSIYKDFAANRDKLGCSKAYARLRHDLAEHFGDLAPAYMTPKELHSILESTEQFTKSDRDSDTATDPKELVSAWLRGDIEMSRIPLEQPIEMGGDA